MESQTKYCKMLARSLIANASGICGAIDRYLAKADEDLKKTLEEEGYAEAEKTVSVMNDMEDCVAAALQAQTEILLSVLAGSKDKGWKKAKKKIAEMLADDDIADQISGILEEMLNAEIPRLATAYIKESDGELVVECIRRSTSEWIASIYAKPRSYRQKVGSCRRIVNASAKSCRYGRPDNSKRQTFCYVRREGWNLLSYVSKRQYSSGSRKYQLPMYDTTGCQR